MQTEFLDFDFEIKALDKDEPGTFEGHASVFGNVDSYADVVMPGAFRRSLTSSKRKKRLPLMLWQHDTREPIGAWLQMKEDAHGLYVKGQLLIDDIPKARQAHALMKAQALSGLSIGYRTVESVIDDKKKVRRLTDVDLFEVSIVSFPANSDARVTDIKTVTGFGDLPLAPKTRAWDGASAEKRLRAWADAESGPNAKYRRGFVLAAGDGDDFAAHKLAIADVIDGTLVAVPRGVFAAAAILSGARGGLNASDAEKSAARRHIERYYEKMRQEFDDESIVPPWRKAEDGDIESAVCDILRMARDATITERECEDILRDAGFSRKQAKAFMADGYRGLIQRDAGETSDDWSERMRKRVEALTG